MLEREPVRARGSQRDPERARNGQRQNNSSLNTANYTKRIIFHINGIHIWLVIGPRSALRPTLGAGKNKEREVKSHREIVFYALVGGGVEVSRAI